MGAWTSVGYKSDVGLDMDAKLMSPGSTVPHEQELTEKTYEFVYQHENEHSPPQDADCNVEIQGQKPVDGPRIPLISSLESMPSQHTSVVSNTEHNEAKEEHTDGGSGVHFNTPLSLRPDAAVDNRHLKLSHDTHVFRFTNTSAELKEISETGDAMFNSQRVKVSQSDANAKRDLPFYYGIDRIDEEGHTRLYRTALEGHLEGVDDLISRGANPNKPSKDRFCPLHAAAHEGHTHIVDLLILQGADVNVGCDLGQTPLHNAAAKGYVDTLESFTAEGANVNAKDDIGWTPFNTAVQYGHLEAVKYLMTEGAKQNRYAGMTPLFAAAQVGHLDIVKFLISKQAGVNEEDDKGRIPLHGAAANSHLDVIEYLIRQGSDVDKGDANGWTPFNAAVQYGHLEAVKYLVNEGAKQNRSHGMTPLYAAAQFGHLDIVKFLISKQAGVNEEDDKERIPLHGASAGGNLKIMEYLIQQGSYVNKEDNTGWTPFHAAIQCGRLEAVKYLMNEGAKQNRSDGITPLYTAAQFGHLDIVKFFISKQAGVNEEDDKGRIPLHGAAANSHLDVIEYPIRQGSDVNHKDTTGCTTLNAVVQGTSSKPVWKIGTKRRRSVDRCSSVLALEQTFLQMIIALAIILAGSPVLVAGSYITERVTLQAGKPGMVQFHLQWPPNSTSYGFPYFTLRFESQRRSFCINGEFDIEGFKSPSQLPRFATSVTELDTSPCVNLIINNVDSLDEDGYVLTAVWHSFFNVMHEIMMKEIVVQIPPRTSKMLHNFK